MSEIIKVALSGGPCSGKTTCINRIKAYFENRGLTVLVCPESATQIIDEGVSRDDMLKFEIAVANRQIENEQDIDERLKSIITDKALVLYDRGLTDCFGYVDDTDTFTDAIGIDRVSSWSRYDAVMMLENADDYEPTDIRTESESDAKHYADRMLRSWIGHPHLRYIPSSDNFADKINRVCDEINCLVDNVEQEKKYLIDYPSIADLSKYAMCKTEIEQIYLVSDIGSHRIRRRVVDSVATYFETVKIRISDAISTEFENIITEDEYESLKQKADPKKCPIVKNRYCILYNCQYFELDVFPFWDDKAFLELELRSANQTIDIPPEITIIKDVSEDKKYKNNNLAKMLYKEQKNENS